MKISVRGFDTQQRRIIKSAVAFFSDQLMDLRTRRRLNIKIVRKSSIDVMAECGAIEDGRSPKCFKIDIRAHKRDDDIIKTLAHEMVHVKQFAKNELSARLRRVAKGKGHQYEYVMKWFGLIWEPKAKEDEYWDAPWEIEAYGREHGLYQKWLNV